MKRIMIFLLIVVMLTTAGLELVRAGSTTENSVTTVMRIPKSTATPKVARTPRPTRTPTPTPTPKPTLEPIYWEDGTRVPWPEEVTPFHKGSGGVMVNVKALATALKLVLPACDKETMLGTELRDRLKTAEMPDNAGWQLGDGRSPHIPEESLKAYLEMLGGTDYKFDTTSFSIRFPKTPFGGAKTCEVRYAKEQNTIPLGQCLGIIVSVRNVLQ